MGYKTLPDCLHFGHRISKFTNQGVLASAGHFDFEIFFPKGYGRVSLPSANNRRGYVYGWDISILINSDSDFD